MSTVVEDPQLDLLEQTDEFDGSDYAHYAPKDGLVEAMIYGSFVTALCGWRFVPMRDPEKFPVCPRCREIRSRIPQ
jgi:Protein of unknown function (DUF3039)